MTRILFAAVALLSVSVPLSGTGVVAFRTTRGIVLGADSAMTSFDRRGEVMSVEATGCKIGTSGSWFYTWGGLQVGGTTDLRPLFDHSIARATSLGELNTAVTQFWRRDLETLDWRTLATTFAVGRVVFWTAVGRVVDGRPELGIFRATIAQHDPLRLDTMASTCPGDCAAGQAHERGPIAELLSSEPRPSWLARLDGPAAHRLLSEQADATPRFVKRPLDVLEPTSSGARWIHRDTGSFCPVDPNDLGGSK